MNEQAVHIPWGGERWHRSLANCNSWLHWFTRVTILGFGRGRPWFPPHPGGGGFPTGGDPKPPGSPPQDVYILFFLPANQQSAIALNHQFWLYHEVLGQCSWHKHLIYSITEVHSSCHRMLSFIPIQTSGISEKKTVVLGHQWQLYQTWQNEC